LLLRTEAAPLAGSTRRGEGCFHCTQFNALLAAVCKVRKSLSLRTQSSTTSVVWARRSCFTARGQLLAWSGWGEVNFTARAVNAILAWVCTRRES
jgi:hypothetical protein